MRRATLLSDFGTRDGYVAAMKGVIATIAPSALLDDATHDMPPGDILAAALTLRRYWKLYPPGTVHVAVVDPGVGSERAAIAMEAEDRYFVGPDNGVFTFIPAGRVIRAKRTYADVAEGEPLSLLNSDGLLEIAVRNGSAAETLGVSRGAEVRLIS